MSFYVFHRSIQSEIEQYCETLREINSSENDIGSQWWKLYNGMAREPMDTSSSPTQKLVDSQKVETILNVFNNEELVSKSEIAELSSATVAALGLELGTNLTAEGFHCFLQSLLTWEESPKLGPFFDRIVLPKMVENTLSLETAESVAKCHPRNFSEFVLKPLLLQHPTVPAIDILSCTFRALDSESKHSLINDYLVDRSLDESTLPVVQAMLPSLPASVLPFLAQSVLSSAGALSNNHTFAKFLLQLCRLHAESLTSSVKQVLLQACKSNRTLLKRQIVWSLES